MDIALFLGRLLLGGYFVLSAFNHFTNRNMLAQYVASKNVSFSMPAVLITGFLLLIGGLSILLGAFVSIGITCLFIFLIPTTYFMHAFWKEEGMNRVSDKIQFMKNVALLGALIIIFVTYAGNWAFAFNSVI